MKRTWPDDWESRKKGDSCPFCENLNARSFHSGRASETILERNAIANGHAAVVFRGRHVAALTDLSSNELADYSHDIQTVGLIIERIFSPLPCELLATGQYRASPACSRRTTLSRRRCPGTTVAMESVSGPGDDLCRPVQAPERGFVGFEG
jgi:hypothetical protein